MRKFYYVFNRLDMIIEFRIERFEMKKSIYCAIIFIASTILMSCTPAYAHDFLIAGDADADIGHVAMNAEYLERFHGMPYRGVYVYPYPQES